MIEKTRNNFNIIFTESGIEASHDRENLAGPEFIKYNGEIIASDFKNYVDQSYDKAGLVRHSKGHKESGVDTVEIEGYLPIGNEIHFKSKYHYMPNHVRITTDILLHKGTIINRHFGVGSFFLHGSWLRYHLIPAVRHLEEGAEATTYEIPAAEKEKIMIGHWHRPPQSIVFEREDGFLFEVSTGFDIWRWESNLGYSPESGSYKLLLSEHGIEIIREPLMCCEAFEPRSGQYRFTWYLGFGEKSKIEQNDLTNVEWLNPIEPIIPNELNEEVGIDLGSAQWHTSLCRITSDKNFDLGKFSQDACFANSKVQAHLKRTLRRINEKKPKVLYLKGFDSGICCNPSHVAKRGKAHYHNDSTYIIDFLEWTYNAFRHTTKVILVKPEGTMTTLGFKY